MKKPLVILVSALAILMITGASYIFYFGFGPGKKSADLSANLGAPAATITRTANGFEPNTITIKKGDVVLFNSTAKNFYWPASDIHPTHGIYPEFDPKRPIAPDENWEFKFDRVGTWRFHDHIQANITGTITVTE